MIKILRYLDRKDITYMLITCVLILAQVGLSLQMPGYMSTITQLIKTPGSTMSQILQQGLYMLLCALGTLLISVINGFCTAYVSSHFSMTLRKEIFHKVMTFSSEEIKKFQTSSLITRTTNDVNQMEMMTSLGLIIIIQSPVMAVWAILKILDKSSELSLLTFGCVVVLLVIVSTIFLIVIPRFAKVQKLIDKVNGVTRENLTGIRVIRAFNAETYQEDRFNAVNEELTKTQLFNQRVMALMSPSINFVMHFLQIGIYFLGAILIEAANVTDRLTLFSNIVVFSSYGMQVISSFLMIAMIFMFIPRAKISADRINEVLDEPIDVLNGEISSSGTVTHDLVFDHVSFHYPDSDENVLQDISFSAKQGQTIAIIGSTGSGKSTLLNLIVRFYDVTEGKILLDGINIRDYTLNALHNKVGYVSQKAFMFNGTVAYNVAFGEKEGMSPSLDEICNALDIAQASEFVAEMEDGVNSHIARGGTNVSGGQKQRLSIARAIARKPEIYLFDDSFSALDYKTDSLLRTKLKETAQDSIVLIVAQRIGTILHADQIVVLDEGKCVGIGTHRELLENCKVYQEIAYSQLSKEELENA
ncbi:MAG: ABC transporter ATP-binding protein [Erysipelotrichaceae bacterium]|nr:ABC transporter ATP-binding protein [Erysipelotrichaceae bacterium]